MKGNRWNEEDEKPMKNEDFIEVLNRMFYVFRLGQVPRVCL